MGLVEATLKLIVKAAVVFAGAGLLAALATLLVLPTLPAPAAGLAKGSTLFCFLLGMALLVFTKRRWASRWPFYAGAVVAGVTSVASFLVALPRVFVRHPEMVPALLLITSLAAIVFIHWRTDWFVTLDLVYRGIAAAVEVTGIPEAYLEPGRATAPDGSAASPVTGFAPTGVEVAMTPAYGFLSAATRSGIPCGLRLEARGGRLRLCFVTWAHSQESAALRARRLEQYLRSLLPRFTFRLRTALSAIELPSGAVGHSAYLRGELRTHPDPLRSLAETIARQPEDSFVVFQVFASPRKLGFWTRWWARRRYARVTRKAAQQVTQPLRLVEALRAGQGQRSFNQVDMAASSEAARWLRRLRRVEADVAVDCRIAVAAWGPSPSAAAAMPQRLLSLLAGVIGQSDAKTAPRVRNHPWLGGRPFRRLLRGNPAGAPTLLSVEEAAPLFEVPRCDLGIPVSEREAFYTGTEASDATSELPAPAIPPSDGGTPSIMAYNGPQTSTALQEALDTAAPTEPGAGARTEGIQLGQLYRSDQLTRQTFQIGFEDLRRHVLIVGNTGSGKTCTAQHVAVELAKAHIPFLVLATVKTEWRRLRVLIPELRIFTVADEQTAPLRWNLFQVPSGVKVAPHIAHVGDAFQAAWPVEGVLAIHLRKAVRRVYRNAGWNAQTNRGGQPILLEDFYRAMLETATEMRYGPEMKQDFEGALQARVETLLDDEVLAALFNTPQGLTLEDLLAQPTVIELDLLSDEHKALLAGLLLTAVAEYLSAQGPQPKLRSVLFVEEAHRILKAIPVVGDPNAAASSQQQSIDTIVNLLAEARTYGLSVVLIDQLPSRLAADAVKLLGTKIVHVLTSGDDRHRMAVELNCMPRQERHISAMRRGDALVFVAGRGHAVHLHVPNLETKCSELRRHWSDEEVREAMAAFYAEQPHLLKQCLPPPVSQLRARFLSEIQKEELELPEELEMRRQRTVGQTLEPPTSLAMRQWQPDAAFRRRLGLATQEAAFMKRWQQLLNRGWNGGSLAPAAGFLVRVARMLAPDSETLYPCCEHVLAHVMTPLMATPYWTLHDPLRAAIHDYLFRSRDDQVKQGA